MARLTPDKVRKEHGLIIYEKIIPWGAKWNKNSGKYRKGQRYKADRLLSGGTGKVKGVTIHNSDGNANAETYTRATYPNQNMKSSRVHYYVDDREIWQNLKDNEVGWHAGDGRGAGNDTTISIEILLQGKAVKDGAKAEERGAKLAAILLNKYNLTINNLCTHKHWSGKNCPINILPRWNSFKNKVNNYLKEIQGESGGNSMSKKRNYLKVGDRGANVKKLQQNLIGLGFGVGKAGADGIYGNGTKQAVMNFQKKYRLKIDGLAGVNTQNKINELIKNKNKKKRNYLKVGDRGANVKKLQQNLIRLGFSVGKAGADSIYGNGTKQAVMNFQKKNNLKVDGLAGVNTQKKISEQIRKKNKTKDKGKIYYRVVVGSYSSRKNAQKQQKKLAAKGFDSFIDIYRKK